MADQMADSPPPPGSAKERHSLTLDQRRALRRWANSQTVRPSHKNCIDWFNSQYGQTISQSTVSHSLSPKYSRLDGDPMLSGSRLRYGNWPDVEKLVLLWHQQERNSGREPSNEQLAKHAKEIFEKLPKYNHQTPPGFSPGWIHRFKKRYNLLVRRQRKGGSAGGTPNPAEDVAYLVDVVPGFMAVGPDTTPVAIRDTVQRIEGIEPSLATCARVRDEIARRLDANQQHGHPSPPHPHNGTQANGAEPAPMQVYGDDDPAVVLQNALSAFEHDEAEAEATAAAAAGPREDGARGSLHGAMGAAYAQQAAASALTTPVHNSGGGRGGGGGGAGRYTPSSTGPRYDTHGGADLTLTPIPGNGPTSLTDRPVRCPFCVNTRMLRTIKEAVEHMSTHVVV